MRRVITTHNPDLLDQIDIQTEGLLVVSLFDGATRIAPVDPASREAIQNHLSTPGELLRMDQLEPDQADWREQQQIELFATSPA